MLLQLKADDEQGAEDGEEVVEDDVKEVEPDVEGEGLAADVQGMPALLRQVGVVEILLLLLHIKACSFSSSGRELDWWFGEGWI